MIRLLTILTLLVSSVQASDVDSLSPELKKQLRTEMKYLDTGFKRLIKAWYSGKMDTVVTNAEKMRDSYILKQALTEAQMHELHTSLPEGFRQMDHQFHADANALAEAARANDTERMGQLVGKLAAACYSCHAEYAAYRFKAFEE